MGAREGRRDNVTFTLRFYSGTMMIISPHFPGKFVLGREREIEREGEGEKEEREEVGESGTRGGRHRKGSEREM